MSLVTNRNNIFKKGVIGNVRKAQEDSHDMALDTPNGDVFVVCDGMGGHVGGAKASSLAVDSIISYLKKEKYSDPLVALNGALQFANMQILGFAAANPEYKGMGTTACIVLMQGSEAWIAHVGDSRIYLYLGKEKKLHRITKDHSYVQTLVDAGKISDEQAEHHPNKNRILKALGVTPNLQPSFNPNNKPIRPKNGDIFLICSDGLSGMIPDKTIEKVLGNNTSIEDKGELLINLAMEGETIRPGGQDNCTVELIQVDNSSWKKSEYESFNPSKSKNKGKKTKLILTIIAAVLVLFVVLGALGVYLNNMQTKDKLKKEMEKYKGVENAASDSIKKIKENHLSPINQNIKKYNEEIKNNDGVAYKQAIINKLNEEQEKKSYWENEMRKQESIVTHAKQQIDSLMNKK